MSGRGHSQRNPELSTSGSLLRVQERSGGSARGHPQHSPEVSTSGSLLRGQERSGGSGVGHSSRAEVSASGSAVGASVRASSPTLMRAASAKYLLRSKPTTMDVHVSTFVNSREFADVSKVSALEKEVAALRSQLAQRGQDVARLQAALDAVTR